MAIPRRHFSPQAPAHARNPECGQALVEFAGACALLLATLLGCGSLLMAEWNRTRCAYLAFETAHALLTGRHPPKPVSQIPSLRLSASVREHRDAVEVVQHCGQARETVRLPRLEPEP